MSPQRVVRPLPLNPAPSLQPRRRLHPPRVPAKLGKQPRQRRGYYYEPPPPAPTPLLLLHSSCEVSGTGVRGTMLRSRCAMSGTYIETGAAFLECNVSYWHAICLWCYALAMACAVLRHSVCVVPIACAVLRQRVCVVPEGGRTPVRPVTSLDQVPRPMILRHMILPHFPICLRYLSTLCTYPLRWYNIPFSLCAVTLRFAVPSCTISLSYDPTLSSCKRTTMVLHYLPTHTLCRAQY